MGKRKIHGGRTRKHVSSRAPGTFAGMNFQESDEDGYEESIEDIDLTAVGTDADVDKVALVVEDVDEGEDGDIEDIADDDSDGPSSGGC